MKNREKWTNIETMIERQRERETISQFERETTYTEKRRDRHIKRPKPRNQRETVGLFVS